MGCSSARGTARAWVRRWARNSVRACVVAVVRCLCFPSASWLSRGGSGVFGASRDGAAATPSTRSRLSTPSTPSTRHAIDAGEPWADGFQKNKGRRRARRLESGVHSRRVGGFRRGARRGRRRRLGRRRRRGLVRGVDPARAFMLLSRRRRSCSLGGAAATPSTPSTREGSQKTKDAVIGRRLERRVDRRTV